MVEEPWEMGCDNLDVKGNSIDPWTDKVQDLADFKIVVPKFKKTYVELSKKDALLSDHWAKHECDRGEGIDRMFTCTGQETSSGGEGNDHLDADGYNCTRVGSTSRDISNLMVTAMAR